MRWPTTRAMRWPGGAPLTLMLLLHQPRCARASGAASSFGALHENDALAVTTDELELEQRVEGWQRAVAKLKTAMDVKAAGDGHKKVVLSEAEMEAATEGIMVAGIAFGIFSASFAFSFCLVPMCFFACCIFLVCHYCRRRPVGYVAVPSAPIVDLEASSSSTSSSSTPVDARLVLAAPLPQAAPARVEKGGYFVARSLKD